MSRVLVALGLVAALAVVGWLASGPVSAQPGSHTQAESDAETLEQAKGLNAEAIRLYRAGQTAEAIALAERALAIAEEVLGPHDPRVAISLNNLSVLLQEMGDLRGAKRYLERAHAILEVVLGPHDPKTATSLNNLGTLHLDMGDPVGARPYLERALAIREEMLPPDHPETAQSLHNLGGLHLEVGDVHGAMPLFERALMMRLRVLGPYHLDTALSWIDLGDVLSATGEHEAAKLYFESALTIQEGSLPRGHPEIAFSLSKLANLLRWMGEFEAAKRYCERALVIREAALGPEHPDTARSLKLLGALLHNMKDFSGAKSHYERALAVFEEVLGPDHPDTASTLRILAMVLQVIGDIAQAISLMESAMDAEEHNLIALLEVGSEVQKEIYLDTLMGSSFAAVSLHVQSAPQVAGATSLALNTVLRRKGRALDASVESLRLNRQRLSPTTQALFELLIELRGARSYLAVHPPEALESDERRARIEELDQEIRETGSSLSGESAGSHGNLKPVTLVDVQATLSEDVALVEFFVYMPVDPTTLLAPQKFGEPRFVAYVLRRAGEPRWADLGEARSMNAAVKAFLDAVAGRDIDVLDRARALDALTMEKVRPLLDEDVSTLVISPDGVLNQVPFAALVDETGHYLIEQYGLSYVTSGRDLLRTGEVETSPEEPLLLGDAAFGGDFGSSGARGETQRAGDMTTLRFGPLPGTAQEVAEIGKLLELPSERVLIGEAATEAAVKAVEGPRILHLATHGYFLEDLPEQAPAEWPVVGSQVVGARLEDPLLRSGLALSGFNRWQVAESANDGVLTALEVAGLNLWGTEVVTLSACETGLGEVRTGEGVFGLRRALVLAGSQTQVMTLWKVADEETKELMVSWYGQLLAGVGRSEAMRQVQLAALRAEALPVTEVRLRGFESTREEEELTDPRLRGTRHPYYWASFIVSGETGPIGPPPTGWDN